HGEGALAAQDVKQYVSVGRDGVARGRRAQLEHLLPATGQAEHQVLRPVDPELELPPAPETKQNELALPSQRLPRSQHESSPAPTRRLDLEHHLGERLGATARIDALLLRVGGDFPT